MSNIQIPSYITWGYTWAARVCIMAYYNGWCNGVQIKFHVLVCQSGGVLTFVSLPKKEKDFRHADCWLNRTK